MENFGQILVAVAGFGIVAVAANVLAQFFLKLKLPMITGFLVVGIAAGPFVLDLLKPQVTLRLDFIMDFSLAFIAFAAGSELFLKDLRGRIRSILWMTFGQLVVTFVMGAVAVYLLADMIPFMQPLSTEVRVVVALLFGTIFVARSPSSAIAVINELRAKGPFTQTAIGVTVVKDVLVVILFATVFSIAKTIVNGEDFSLSFLMILLGELLASFLLGYGLGKLIGFILSKSWTSTLKMVLVLLLGYLVFVFSHLLGHYSAEHLGLSIHMEPLLICLVASFVVTNYTAVRAQFEGIIHDLGPTIYVLFFTLIGATMSLDILANVWQIALVLFGIRLVSMVLGGFLGGSLAGDPWKFNRIAWMPYVTQAGVALGLAAQIAKVFPDWGPQFATVVIAVIVLNQIVGPPLFKWAIHHVKENHDRAATPEFDGIRDAIIFGYESQSRALARQLRSHGWEVKLATFRKREDFPPESDLEVYFIEEVNMELFDRLDAGKSEAIVMMLSDEENYTICELAYEKLGTKDLVVRLNDRANLDRFHKLGALVVDPTTAIVSLLDHFVRSPNAASLLLGMEENQDTIQLEVLSPDLFGLAVRDLRLPPDVLIISVERNGQMLITHGYTRLRPGDLVTLVGSVESLESATLKFDK